MPPFQKHPNLVLHNANAKEPPLHVIRGLSVALGDLGPFFRITHSSRILGTDRAGSPLIEPIRLLAPVPLLAEPRFRALLQLAKQDNVLFLALEAGSTMERIHTSDMRDSVRVQCSLGNEKIATSMKNAIIVAQIAAGYPSGYECTEMRSDAGVNNQIMKALSANGIPNMWIRFDVPHNIEGLDCLITGIAAGVHAIF